MLFYAQSTSTGYNRWGKQLKRNEGRNEERETRKKEGRRRRGGGGRGGMDGEDG